jgi:pyruvate ferredoxin oxidoreductase beta subunit
MMTISGPICRNALAAESKFSSCANVLASCNRGWRVELKDSISICEDAVKCCAWPLYEVENGVYTLNYDPKDKKTPVADWLKKQGMDILMLYKEIPPA